MCFDNRQQLNEIERYRQKLSHMLRRDIDINFAAVIWIRKYALLWRLKHPSNVATKSLT